MNKLIEKLEKEFDKKFPWTYREVDTNDKLIREMCLPHDLRDFKAFFRSQLPSLLQAVGEEIIGEDVDKKIALIFSENYFKNELRVQQRSRLKEIIGGIKK